MRNPIIAALLAATLLVPAAALAQDRPYHQRDADDADRPSRADNDRPRDRGDRPDLAVSPRQGRPDYANRPGVDRNRGDQGDWRAQTGRDRDGRPGWRDGNGGDRNGFQGRDGDGRSGWRDHDRDRDGTPDWRDRNDGRDWHGDRDHDWRGDRDRGDWRNGGYDRGGYGRDWNRGWRQDQRYDWNRYRTYNRGAYRLPRYYAPRGWGYGYRRYSVGFRLDAGFFGSNYWIDEPYTYRLPPAYGPYRWVRYYDDALLVDVRTGYIVDTVYGIFW